MSPQTNFPNPNNNVTVVEPSLATKLFASALFSGYSPIASGTMGSAVALAFYFIPGFESVAVVVGVLVLVVELVLLSFANCSGVFVLEKLLICEATF